MRNPLLYDPTWLRARYEEDGMSTTEIARLAGVPNDNATTVRRALERAGVQRRTNSSARKLQWARVPVADGAKACTRCLVAKPLGGFYKLPTTRDGRASWCKECADLASKDSLRRVRIEALDALGGACVRCGEADPVVLVFDHINGGGRQDRRRSKSVFGFYSDIAKGRRTDLQVLCHNCNHRKRVELGEHRAVSL